MHLAVGLIGGSKAAVEPVFTLKRAGITFFLDTASLQPARQVNVVVNGVRVRRCLFLGYGSTKSSALASSDARHSAMHCRDSVTSSDSLAF